LSALQSLPRARPTAADRLLCITITCTFPRYLNLLMRP
jgi:hypothetical protein